MDKVTPNDQDGNQGTRQQSSDIPRKMECNGLKIETGRGELNLSGGKLSTNKDQRERMDQ